MKFNTTSVKGLAGTLSALPILAFLHAGHAAADAFVPLVDSPFSSSSAANSEQWQAQVDPAQVDETIVQITQVSVEFIDQELEITLETADGNLLTVDTSQFRIDGNSLIVDIPNTVLTLPEGEAFSTENPTTDITAIQVTQVTPSSIQVVVAGKEAPPTTEVVLKTGAFAYVLNPGGDETDQELVVTGAAEPGYTVPNASSATRTDTPILDTPQSIQVVPQQVLEDQQIIRVDDALSNVSGVVGRLDAFGTSTRLTIRGFTTDNFTGGAILRDGYRPNDNLGTQEMANVERIEVIKGPASVLYGQNDPGGMINLVTKRPLADPDYSLGFQVGSSGLLRPSVDLSGPLNDDRSLRYRLNLAYQHEDGFRDFNVSTDRFFIAPVLSWDISQQTNLTLLLEYTDEKNPFDLGLPVIGDRVVDVPRDRVLGTLDDVLKNRALTLGYDLQHQFNDNWTLNHGFRYVTQDYKVSPALPFVVNPNTGNITLFFAERAYHSDDYTFQTNAIGKFKTGSIQHTLLAGVDLNFNRFDDRYTRIDRRTPLVQNIFNPVYGTVPRPDLSGLQPFPPFDTEYDRYAFFLQDQIDFNDQFILVGSLRYDLVDFRIDPTYSASAGNRSDRAWSPRIGLIYKPIETVSLYTSYSQSFKPNFSRDANGNSPEPEKASGFEMGVKSELLDGRVFATLSYFDITKSNVATTDPNNPLFTITSGEQRSQGIELDVAGEILPGWNIIANYAYADARVTKDNDIPVGNRLFNAPYHSAGLWTSYEVQRGDLQGLGFGLGINYVGDRAGDLANTFTVGDYFLTRMGVFYKRDNWRLGLNVNNLFNVNYISSTTNARNFGNAPGAPLSVIGTVSVEF